MVRSVTNMFRGSLMSPILAGFLMVCCVLGSCANRNVEPGFKARISQKSLDHLRDVGIQTLEEQSRLVDIPDTHGSTYGVLADYHYDVTELSIKKLTIPSASSSLTTDPATGGLTLKTSGVFLKVHGRYRYNICGLSFCSLLPIWDSGHFDASASSIYISVTLRIGVDTTGRPSISSRASDCYINIGDLDVDLRGGIVSWIYYYLLKSKIEGYIKDALNEQICGEVIDGVKNKLKNLQVIAPVPAPVDVIELDYSLAESPSFNGYVSTAHKGGVYPIGSKTECPLSVPKIPPDSDTSRMVFIWITEYLPNSAGYVLQDIGFLQYNVTPDNVPAGAKNLLNTSYFAFGLVMPQINKLYPNMAMQINVNSTKAPVIKIASTGVQADLVGDFTTYAILPNKTLAYLFTVSMTISAKVSVNFTGNNITWNIMSFSATVEALRSAEGPIFTSGLQFELGNTFFLNQFGAVGIPLPQLENFPDGLMFTNPVIYLGEGFLKIGTDLNYTP